VVKLDHLGCSIRDVLNLVHELEAEGAALTVLEPAFSTKDAAGPILVTVLGMVAEMERKFIRERQQAGIEAAKARVSTRVATPAAECSLAAFYKACTRERSPPPCGAAIFVQRTWNQLLLGRLFRRGRISLGLSVLIGGLLHQPKGSQPRGLILHGLCLSRLLSLRLLAPLSALGREPV